MHICQLSPPAGLVRPPAGPVATTATNYAGSRPSASFWLCRTLKEGLFAAAEQMGPAAPSGLSWRVGGRARAEKPGENRPARPRAASLGVRPPLPLPRACAGDGLLLLLVAGSASRSALALAWIALRTSLDERPRPRPARPPLIPGSCRGALPLRWLSAPPPSPRAFAAAPPTPRGRRTSP